MSLKSVKVIQKSHNMTYSLLLLITYIMVEKIWYTFNKAIKELKYCMYPWGGKYFSVFIFTPKKLKLVNFYAHMYSQNF